MPILKNFRESPPCTKKILKKTSRNKIRGLRVLCQQRKGNIMKSLSLLIASFAKRYSLLDSLSEIFLQNINIVHNFPFYFSLYFCKNLLHFYSNFTYCYACLNKFGGIIISQQMCKYLNLCFYLLGSSKCVCIFCIFSSFFS